MADNNTQYGSPCELIPQMKEKLAAGEEFRLVVTGYSMSPTLIHLKDSVCILPLERGPKKGEIVLIDCRPRCILHRVVKIRGDMFFTRGDAQAQTEGPFTRGDVIGVVSRLERDGKQINRRSYSSRASIGLHLTIRKAKKIIIKLVAAIKKQKYFRK